MYGVRGLVSIHPQFLAYFISSRRPLVLGTR